MLPYMLSQYGNAHSRTHAYGWESEKAVEKAREVINNFLIFIVIKLFNVYYFSSFHTL